MGFLTGISGGSTGIFRGDGGVLTQIARAGDTAPDANGILSDFGIPALNDAGQAAFFGLLTGTSGGASDNRGIFRGDGGPLTQIARTGDAAPDANGSFSFFNDPALNEAGQAAFFGFLTGTSGIFFFDDELGLLQVAREGDSFLGSTVTLLEFNSGIANIDVPATGEEWSGLNALGQVAFWFELADNRQGVAIWTAPNAVPEPRTLVIFILCQAIMCCTRKMFTKRKVST